MPMRSGRNAGDPPADQPAERLQPQRFGLLARRDDAGGGGVVLAAGVARGHGGLRVGLGAGSALARRAISIVASARGVLVGRERLLALAALDRDRHDLIGEAARFLRTRPRVACERDGELVLLARG